MGGWKWKNVSDEKLKRLGLRDPKIAMATTSGSPFLLIMLVAFSSNAIANSAQITDSDENKNWKDRVLQHEKSNLKLYNATKNKDLANILKDSNFTEIINRTETFLDDKTSGNTNQDLDLPNKSGQHHQTNKPDDHFLEDKVLFDILGKFLGEKYPKCITRSKWTTFIKTAKFHCSCNVNRCGYIGNCCPDVNPETVKKIVSKQNGPSCSHRFNSLYTNFTIKSFKAMHSGSKTQQISVRNPVYTDSMDGTQTYDTASPDHISLVNKPIKNSKLSGQKNLQAAEQCLFEDTRNTNSSEKTYDVFQRIRELAQHYPQYLTIDTCDDNFKDEEIIKKCLDKDSLDIEAYIPVSSTKGNVYRNYYCAKCNGENFSKRWDIATDCVQLYLVSSLPNNISRLFEMTHDCIITFVPSTWIDQDSSKCEPSAVLDGQNINGCNLTGTWKHYDPKLESLCLTMEHMARYDVLIGGNRTSFKNVFCYMCNTNVTRRMIKPFRIKEHSFQNASLWMETRIQVDDSRTQADDTIRNQTEVQCPDEYVQGVYGEGCIGFHCRIDEISTNSFCFRKSTRVVGLAIGACIHFKSIDNGINNASVLSETTMMLLAEGIHSELEKVLRIKENGCKCVFSEVFGDTSSGLNNGLFVTFRLLNTDKCSVSVIIEIFRLIVSRNIIISAGIPFVRGFRDKKHMFSLQISNTHKAGINSKFNVTIVDAHSGFNVTFDSVFHCPYVSLDMTTFRSLTTNKKVILKEIGPNYHYTDVVSHTVKICYSDYIQQWLIEKYDTSHKEEVPQTFFSAELTFITTVISIFSTIAVLVTYTLFSELRFIPGKLFMVLCVNLLFAQVSFALGIGTVESKILCKIIGFLIHVFNLSVLFSMKSCLWLMFKTSKQPLETNNRVMMQSRSSHALCKLVVSCYAFPVLCAGANIYVARTWYHDENYGYGGDVCFISQFTLKLITFVCPIVLVLFINFVMFAIIIASISRVVFSNGKMNSVKQFTVLFKLATITGLFWLFGLLYEATEYSVFEYLFIIFHAGHGFFLMWSFLFNSRVLELYKSFYRKHIMSRTSEWSLSLSVGSNGNRFQISSKSEVIEKVASSDV